VAADGRAADGPTAVRAARTAVAWVFAANGFAFAGWASRLPALRDAFGLSPARVGLVLLAACGDDGGNGGGGATGVDFTTAGCGSTTTAAGSRCPRLLRRVPVATGSR